MKTEKEIRVSPRRCPKCDGVVEMWGAPRRWMCTVCGHEMPGPEVALERLEIANLEEVIKTKDFELNDKDYTIQGLKAEISRLKGEGA